MGKKGSWISAIKRLFRSNSNPNLNHEAHKKSKPKRFKHGSFLPFCKEPSSIEQILGEIDQHNLFIPTAQQQPQPQPQPQQQSQPQQHSQPQPQPQQHSQLQQESQPQQHSQPQPQTQQESQPQQPSQPQTQPQAQQSQQQQRPQPQPQPQPQQQQSHSQPQLQPQPQPSSSSSGRPLSPLQRLISHPKITSPKISHRPELTLQQRHLSATRIQAAYRGYMARRSARGLTSLVRLQRVVTSKSVKRQTVNAMKQMQLLIRVQSQVQSRRLQMLEHQAHKQQSTKNSPHKPSEERWDDSLITKEEKEARLQRKADAAIRREKAMAYAYTHQLRKDTPTSAQKTSVHPWWWKWLEHELPYHMTPNTPKNHQFAATPSRPTTPMSSRSTNRLIKTRKGGSSVYSMKDDDSLRSCPPFSVPHYMSPTASARAKARPTSNPKERCVTPTTPGSETSSKRRFSSPFTPNNKSPGSVVSMDSSAGRKPFNRFV